VQKFKKKSKTSHVELWDKTLQYIN